jgi:hypothetical protein
MIVKARPVEPCGEPSPAPVKPLFVPLRATYWKQFRARSKTTEWRAWGPRWNDRVIAPWRAVVLSCGYSGPRLHGVVVSIRRVARSQAPIDAQAIYPDVEAFCAFDVDVDVQ